MRQRTRGLPTVKFVPLPAQLGRDADWNFRGKPPVRDVPYVPTPEHVVAKMLDLANVTSNDIVYDLGCGDGRIVITAAKELGARGAGIDIDPDRIKQCELNAINAGVSNRVRFELTSVFRADIAEASVVALYLLPWMNAQLRPRLLTELKPGTRIVAHQFPISGWSADRIVRIAGQDRVVYLWIVPANVAGCWQVALRTRDGVLRHGTIDFEQELQTILPTATLDGRDCPIDDASLCGDRLSLTLDDVVYHARVDGDTIRGSGQRAGGRAQLEIRGQRLKSARALTRQ
jgi:SAM-dependent methyltransferase